MRAVWMIVPPLLLAATTMASATELAQIPRTITVEPDYEGTPKYGLLVLGAEADKRVWIVHDGATLYADHNGDGDLSDESERFAAHEQSDADGGSFRFDVGDVREGDVLHKSLSVRTLNLQGLAPSEPQVRQILESDPQARIYRVTIALEMPIHRGAGIDGRVEHIAGPIDAAGLLRFADSPDEAPIIYFGGPWQITLFGGDSTLTAGRQTELFLGLGTPGLGAGTTAFAAYQGLIPAGKFPKLHVTLPGDDEAVECVLRERCCTVNFHGGVRLPEDAPTGEASVRVSFHDWFGGFAAPTDHRVKIVKPRTEITLEPVSPRLKGSLVHAARDGDLVGLKYSPDGRRIVAGDYPGGTIQVWDVESGEPLTTIETAAGYGATMEYFHLTPDWQSVFVSRRGKRELTRVERDGKQVNRWEFDGNTHCWDVATGELRSRLQHSPPRSVITMALSPDGKQVLTGDEIPGESEGHPGRALTLWDTDAGTSRFQFSDVQAHCVFDADGSRFAVSQQSEDFFNPAVDVYDIETGERMLSIPILEQPAQATVMDFTPDGSVLIGRITVTPNRRDRSLQQSYLKFWDTTTGAEVGSIEARHKGENFSWPATFSPDRRTYILGNWHGARAELYLIDIERRQIATTVELDDNATVRGQVFSPDGRWIAAATQHVPQNVSPYVTAADLPQPRIHLIESATGQVRETIVAPQCFLASLCFSPDGSTLASSGPGRVLLWDLSTPPGESDSTSRE